MSGSPAPGQGRAAWISHGRVATSPGEPGCHRTKATTAHPGHSTAGSSCTEFPQTPGLNEDPEFGAFAPAWGFGPGTVPRVLRFLLVATRGRRKSLLSLAGLGFEPGGDGDAGWYRGCHWASRCLQSTPHPSQSPVTSCSLSLGHSGPAPRDPRSPCSGGPYLTDPEILWVRWV